MRCSSIRAALFCFGGIMKKGLIVGTALAAAAAAGIAVFCIMRGVYIENPAAEIRLDGEVIRTIPLTQDCEFTVDCGSGTNTIRIADGAVSVVAADCPDQICVKTGAISGGLVPIVCLPHKLEIVIVSGDSVEADTAAY